ncbi:MAG: zinc ribbon domain-containing protein [Actinomycetes bacterium]|jgi:RNA polymerase subunit RPABC4/transcription elongation factor Spt4|nr:zinc ribbon domain-containing protein [Actinomycetes bacterium]
MNDLLKTVLDNKTYQFVSLIVGVLGFLFAIALVFWVVRDARRRGARQQLWLIIGGLGVLIGAIVGFTQTKFGFGSVGLLSLSAIAFILVVYVLVRPGEYRVDAQEREMSLRLLEAELDTHACPSCGAGIEVDYLVCPVCSVTLRRPCESCGRAINPRWRTCPYCTAAQVNVSGNSGSAGRASRSSKKRTVAGSGTRPAGRGSREGGASSSSKEKE